MGLDITAYSRLAPAGGIAADDEDAYATHVRVLPSRHFPGREAPLSEGWHSFADRMGFRAGSYGGYNDWRERLAKLAGYPATMGGGYRTYPTHAAGAWASTEGPFWELINFSDCDGTIGSAAAQKLARDFAEWDERAKAADPESPWFYDLYQLWRKAFELAADGGCVDFH